MPSQVSAGGTLTCRYETAAPHDRFVCLQMASFLDSWKPRRIPGETLETLVQPGGRLQGSLRVDVPIDLTPGIYRFVVIEIANGVLIVARHYVQVNPFAGTLQPEVEAEGHEAGSGEHHE